MKRTKGQKPKISFDPAWGRICTITGWSKYGELASFLQIEAGSVSGAKRRGSIPIEWLYEIGQHYNVTTDWLATGEDSMRREENSSLQINGNKNFQVNGSVVHAVHTVFAKEERESRAPEPGLASEPPPAAALDPLDAAYLDDWHKLSEVGKMRVWTIVKEEIEKERKGEK